MKKMVTATALAALIGAASACSQGGDANNGTKAGAAAANSAGQAAAAGGAGQVAAAEAEVRALLDRVYAPYATANAPGREIGSFMEPQLAQKMAATEEGIDADPFIDAQDYTPFRPEYRSVRVNGDRAEAAVRISSMGQRTINYQFVRTPDGWKIADVGTEQNGTLRGRYDLPPLE